MAKTRPEEETRRPPSDAPLDRNENVFINSVLNNIIKEKKIDFKKFKENEETINQINNFTVERPPKRTARTALKKLLKKVGLKDIITEADIKAINDENKKRYFINHLYNPVLADILEKRLGKLPSRALDQLKKINEAILSPTDNNELELIFPTIGFNASDCDIALIRAENKRLQKALQDRSITTKEEQEKFLADNRKHNILTKALHASEFKAFDKYIFSDTHEIFYASMNEKDVRDALKDINIRMGKHDPCYQELQKLLSHDSTKDIIYNDRDLFQNFTFLYESSAELMANSLIAMDIKIMRNIDPYEFYLDTNKHPTPTVTTAIEHFNKMGAFICEDIISRPSLEERTLALEHWIRNCLANVPAEPSPHR